MQDEAMKKVASWSLRGWWRNLSRKLRLTFFISGVITALILGGGSTWLYTHHPVWPDPTLVATARTASYPIYYPTTLPKGFSYEKGSATYSANVFIYSLSFDNGKKLFISAIPKPAGVQFNDFYNRILANKTTVLNSAGTAVIGNANNQTLGSLVTSKTWVTMNAPKGIDSQRLQALVVSLKKL